MELVLAIAVFATGFLMILGAFPTAAGAVGQSEALVAATFLTEQRLEETRNKSFEDIQPATLLATVTAGVTGSVGKLQMTTQILVTSTGTRMKRVRAVTTWDAGAAGLKSVELETCVAREG